MLNKLLKILTSRALITCTLILIQIAWLVIVFFRLVENVVWLSVVFTVLSVLIALYIVNRDGNPAYKIAWIFLILLLPLMGSPLYLLFGNKRPARKLREMMRREHARSQGMLSQHEAVREEMYAFSKRTCGTSQYILSQSGAPLCTDTAAKYYSLGDQMLPDILEDLENARHFIFLEYFIINEGTMWAKILEVLRRKASEGVDVRILYDDMGSLTCLPIDFPKRMESIGIRCIAFNRFVPLISLVMNNRDHRKLLIVDGCVGYTGGINLADEYINHIVRFGHWKDDGLRLEGEGVWNMTVMFLEMWNALRPTDESYLPFAPKAYHPQPFEGEGFVQAFGDTPLDDEPVAENVYIDLISQAKTFIGIYTPYLLIDNEMQTALCCAARRGVDVRIYTPGIPDKKLIYQLTRSYYPPLLRAGVKIYEYTPGFLHAKGLVVDDEKAVVGSINLDFRSLYLHFECGVFLYRSPCIADMRADMENMVSGCHQVTTDDCRNGIIGGWMNAVLRLFSPLM